MANRATRLMPHIQLTILAALVLAVIVTAPYSSPRPDATDASPGDTSGQSLPSSPRQAPTPSKLVAERAAAQLLAEVRVPAGAASVPRAPAGTPDMGGPPQVGGAEQLVDDHRFWIVPGPPAVVLAWFGAHAISGSALVGQGSEGTYGVQQLADDVFLLAPLGKVLLSRELMIGVAQDDAGKVIVRVDSQIVWDPTRPWQSMVPSSVTRIVATDTPQQNATGTIGSSRSRSSSGPAVVHHFVAVVNAMPEATSGTISCPAFSGDRYTLIFQSSGGVTLATVTLYQDACLGISVNVAGVASVPLFDPGQALLHALQAFLPPPAG